MDLTSLFGAAIEKLDMAFIAAIWFVVQTAKTLDKKDKFAKFYALLPLVIGMAGGFLMAADWKAALLTGFVHGAVAMALNNTVKSILGISIIGDAGKK